MRGKKLILVATETGCIIPTSHKLNADGYFRKKTNGILEMYHRTVCRSLPLVGGLENGRCRDYPKGVGPRVRFPRNPKRQTVNSKADDIVRHS